MHLLNLDLQPDWGLQFLMIDDMVKLNIDSNDYNVYLADYAVWLKLLLDKDSSFNESLRSLIPYSLESWDIDMYGEWNSDWYRIQIMFPSCDIWLDFDGEDELQSFISYISKWHEWIIQAQEISDI